MNASEYALRVFEAISGGKPDSQSPALRSAIELALPDTLNELAERVYASPRRAVLEKTYTGALVSGAIDLTAGGFADLWHTSLKTAYATYPVSGGTPIEIEFYENSRDIDLPGVAGVYRGSLRGFTYLVRDETGNAPANATVSFVASRIPAIGDLSLLNLNNDVVELGVTRTMRMLQGSQEEERAQGVS